MSAADSRLRPNTLAFVAVTVAAACVLFWAAFTISDIITSRDQDIAEKHDQLLRLKAVIARSGEIERNAAKLADQLPTTDFLAGSNEGLVLADLQGRLKAMAERNGIRIRSIQAQPSKNEEPNRYFGAQMIANGTIGQLRNLLYEIDAARPYLFATSATLKLPQAVAKPADQEPTLEVRLEVYGAADPRSRDK